MDEQRALLDELMGANRNQDNPDALIEDYRDRRVCKHFLLGCCPHDVFRQTKIDMGPCALAHNDELKAKFEAAVADGSGARDHDDYERDLEPVIREHVHEADRKIQRGIRRVEGEGGPGGRDVLVSGPDAFIGHGGGGGGGGGGEESEASSSSKPAVDISTHPEVVKLQEEVEEATAAAEAAKGEGKEDEAKALLEKAEELKKKRAELQGSLLAEAVAKSGLVNAASGSTAGSTTNNNQQPQQQQPQQQQPQQPHRGQGDGQKLRVCDACGAFLSITDNEQRLTDHFGGKLHMGYVQLRTKLKELEDKRWKRGRGGGGGGRDRDRDRDRDRRRSRSRSRDRRRRSRSRSSDRRRRSRSRSYDRRRRSRSSRRR